MNSVEYWELELGNLAPGSAHRYRKSVNGFVKHLGIELDELYSLHKSYLDDGDPRSDRVVPLKLAAYIKSRVGVDWKSGTGHNTAVAVKHFFMSNSLVFPLRPTDIPSAAHNGSRVIQTDEMLRWLELCVGSRSEYRNKALTLASKDLGWRQSDITRLNVEHVLEAQVIDTERGRFRVFKPFITQKRGVYAFPHWGPEAEEAVMLYLDGRTSGPLFLSQTGIRLDTNAIGALYNRFRKRMGEDKITHHSLRKFHRTKLESCIPSSYVKKLQGKATDAYIQPEQTGELTRAYIESYDVLRVFTKDVELEAVKQELSLYKVESDMQRLSQHGKVNELEAKLERMERALQAIYERTKPKP